MNTDINEIMTPESLREIGKKAFYGCRGLTKVVLQEGIQSIGDECFQHCDLDSVVIPCSLTKLGYNAFSDNTSIQ